MTPSRTPRCPRSSASATSRRSRSSSPTPRTPRPGNGRGSKQPKTCTGSSNTSPTVADMTDRSSYKALVTIFSQQCELSDGKVVVKAKTGGDCMQNPSDPDASYDAHKGQGYQVQLAETCSPENEVQLITGALPQSAAEPDGGAVVPMLDQLEEVEVVARGDAGRHALLRRRERAGGRGPRRGVGGSDPRPGAGELTPGR